MTPKLVGSGEIHNFQLILFLMHVPELSYAPVEDMSARFWLQKPGTEDLQNG